MSGGWVLAALLEEGVPVLTLLPLSLQTLLGTHGLRNQIHSTGAGCTSLKFMQLLHCVVKRKLTDTAETACL